MPGKHVVIWERCLEKIKKSVTPQTFQTWFQPISPVECCADILRVELPSPFFCEWLETNYSLLLRKIIEEELGEKGKLEYSIRKSQEDTDQTLSFPHKSTAPKATKKSNSTASFPSLAFTKSQPLNPLYTFENFIEGDCNKFTKSAAKAVADNPGKTSFNPLIIYGGVGLGKTHLSQAIAHRVKEKFGEKMKVQYLSSEFFFNQFVESVRHNQPQAFLNYYAQVDILILEDIQLLASKKKTQDTFFHIFNRLHQHNKQIIITSDQPPNELEVLKELQKEGGQEKKKPEGLQKRLLSRFKWGLIADLQQPSEETWFAIIKSKLSYNNLVLPEEQIDLILKHLAKANVRDLEGIINALVAHTVLTKEDITEALIKKVIQRIVDINEREELDIAYIQQTVAAYYKLPISTLKGNSRKREVVLARQVCMYLIRSYTTSSLSAIGENFGGKDHTTVMYAQKNINHLLDTDKHFRASFQNLKKTIIARNPLAN